MTLSYSKELCGRSTDWSSMGSDQGRSGTVTRERNQESSFANTSVYELANPNYVCKYPEYHSPRERKIFCETIRKKLLKGAGETAQCVKSLLCNHKGLSSDP